MSALAKIKKTAAHHEQERQYDKALAQYARLLDGEAGSDEEVDVTLYNRAGDLALRVGDLSRAVAYFERAIDLYAAGGFLNNAVALAVKILRHAPGHLAAHHTLGVLYARKGFRAEARQHLAEYAAQMHRAGREEEVRRALSELAALGSSGEELGAARELLTTRAAGPEAAGALVKWFDAAVGPAGAPTPDVRSAAARPTASLSLSEMLEREASGDAFVDAPAHAGHGMRWLTALPDEPPPLRLAVLRTTPTFGAASAQGATFAVEAFVADALDVEALGERDGVPVLDAAPASGEPLHVADSSGSRFGMTAEAPEIVELDVWVTTGGHAEADRKITPIDSADLFASMPSNDDAPVSDLDAADLSFDVVGAPPLDLTELAAPVAPAREFAPAMSLLDTFEVPPVGIVPSTADVPSGQPGREFVRPEDDASTDLGEWLRSTEVPATTRLVTTAPRETGDEAADFGVALDAFKAGIAQSVDAGDRESHYDLGVAFREMGLWSDAVREFQRAVGAPGSGLREREALAQSFLDFGRPELALVTLEAAAAAAAAAGQSGETLIGVYYVLAESARATGRADDAREWYVRVLATDYGFRDAAARLAALPPPRAMVLAR